MPTQLRRLGTFALLVLLSTGSAFATEGSNPANTNNGSQQDACGDALDNSQILSIVREAILITGGDPANLEDEYTLSIRPRGCDYVVTGIRQPETIAQAFTIIIARSGEVKSWPWCCVPEFEIGPLEDEGHGVTDPSIVITDAAGSHWPVGKEKLSASCTPALFELQEPVEVPAATGTMSFRLLAVGCAEDLGHAWPPPLDLLEQAFASELQEIHPAQTLLMMWDRSPELRARLTKRLNEILNNARASDVFLFDAQTSEN